MYIYLCETFILYVLYYLFSQSFTFTFALRKLSNIRIKKLYRAHDKLQDNITQQCSK